MIRLFPPLLLILLQALPVISSGQSIYAGQTSGENIVYHDIDDLHIDSPYWNSSDDESLDLDDDGVGDLWLMTSFTYWSHTGTMSASASVNAADNCQYTTLADHPGWICKHASGDLINGSLDWYVEPGPYDVGLFRNTNGEGMFTGEGFMGYRICGFDTIYGWIRIHSSVSFDGAYLTVYDFAYEATGTGTSLPGDNAAVPKFHILGKQLSAVIPGPICGKSGRLKCYDLSGRLILHAIPNPGINLFELPTAHQGMLIIHYSDGRGKSYTKKMMAI